MKLTFRDMIRLLVLPVTIVVLVAGCSGSEPSNAANQSPHIDSSPITTATAGEDYQYAVQASDPDGDGLSYSANHPDWLGFDANLAVLSGQPTAADSGTHAVAISVSDGQESASQSFSIAVLAPANGAPVFISSPGRDADHNREYHYTAVATDPDGDPLTYSAQVPAWLSFDETAVTLTGLATRNNLGNHSVTITVSDGNRQAVQQYLITVGVGEIICNSDFGDPDSSLYVLPYPVGTTYRNTQSYCFTNGGHRNTFAYDFNTQPGDTIVAARDGLVFFTNDQFMDGDITSGNENNVFIEHADGTAVRYTHLMHRGVLVSAGQPVVQGQPIALSGNTGNTGNVPHLHFAVFRTRGDYGRKNTIPVNFLNAEGPLDNNRGLITNQDYRALDY